MVEMEKVQLTCNAVVVGSGLRRLNFGCRLCVGGKRSFSALIYSAIASFYWTEKSKASIPENIGGS